MQFLMISGAFVVSGMSKVEATHQQRQRTVKHFVSKLTSLLNKHQLHDLVQIVTYDGKRK